MSQWFIHDNFHKENKAGSKVLSRDWSRDKLRELKMMHIKYLQPFKFVMTVHRPYAKMGGILIFFCLRLT